MYSIPGKKEIAEMGNQDFFLGGAHVGTCETDIAAHTHPFTEIVWLERGEFTVTAANGTVHRQRAGDVFLIPPGVPHTQSKSPGGETVFVLCSLAGDAEGNLPGFFRTGPDPILRQWFYQLVELFESDRKKKSMLLLLQAILIRLNEMRDPGNDEPPKNAVLEKALDYLAANFRKPECSVPSAAQAAGVSSGHLDLLFRRHLRKSPLGYLVERRISFACQLLENPYWNVGEIAEKSGFSDTAYFCRAFKKRTGMRPGEYREKAKYPSRLPSLDSGADFVR